MSCPERVSKTAVPLVSAMPPAIRQPNRCLPLKQDAGQTLWFGINRPIALKRKSFAGFLNKIRRTLTGRKEDIPTLLVDKLALSSTRMLLMSISVPLCLSDHESRWRRLRAAKPQLGQARQGTLPGARKCSGKALPWSRFSRKIPAAGCFWRCGVRADGCFAA
jgi:hypothetical protein